MKKFSKYISIIAIVVVFGITVGYAALGSEMSISGVVAEIRLKKDIRVTDFSYSSSTSSASISSVDYSNKALLTDIVLPNSDSTVTYKVEVTNFGNVEMGIYELTGLPENLTYEVTDYTLKEKICDTSNVCASGIVKTFYVTIKYASDEYSSTNTVYSLDMKVDFRQFYTISYNSNITNNGYPSEIIGGGNLVITFTNPIPSDISIYSDGLVVDNSLYEYKNGTLKYNNVSGHIVIKEAKTFVSMMSSGAVSDIDVDFSSSDGLSSLNDIAYIRTGTENDANPIYYYRGNVSKNNVIFANLCWKIVRTTETGGVKLIYNGKPGTDRKIQINEYINLANDSVAPYTFNSTTMSWENSWAIGEEEMKISFSVSNYGNYSFDYNITSDGLDSPGGVSVNSTLVESFDGSCLEDGGCSYSINLGYLSDTDIIEVTLGDASRSMGASISFSLTETNLGVQTCDNQYKEETIISTSVFNSNLTSMADIGYMYGTRFIHSYKSLDNQAETYLYGSDVFWDGTSYTLKNTYSSSYFLSDKSTLETQYYYTCFNSTGECTTVNYIYYFGDYGAYYISITGVDNIIAAKSSMYANVNDSEIKSVIDAWYEENLIEYTEKLEDTIWCNDRSQSVNSYNGYGAYDRQEPSLSCLNQNDAFTLKVSEGGTIGHGNNALKYPVGLLTVDELTLAGNGKTPKNYDNFLYSLSYNHDYFTWSMSPAIISHIYSDYNSSSSVVSQGDVRPAISLKPGTEIAGGNGTISSPYIVLD